MRVDHKRPATSMPERGRRPSHITRRFCSKRAATDWKRFKQLNTHVRVRFLVSGAPETGSRAVRRMRNSSGTRTGDVIQQWVILLPYRYNILYRRCNSIVLKEKRTIIIIIVPHITMYIRVNGWLVRKTRKGRTLVDV